MNYKYITKNNLENIQNYMFSEYEGINFLLSYEQTRKNIIQQYENFFSITLLENFINQCKSTNQTFLELLNILSTIKSNNYETTIKQINIFQKRFEVKKRLFYNYELNSTKGIGNYDDLNSYILLSAIMLLTYEHYEKYTYLSTFLKINDSILSQFSILTHSAKQVCSALINSELKHIKNICSKKNIIW